MSQDPSTQPSPSAFERLNQRIKSSISMRLFFIAMLSLLLLIPAGMVEDMIRQREWTKNEVVTRINSAWGNQQSITGPVLTIPYETHTLTKNDEIITHRHQAHFLPESLNIDAQIETEERNISLFKSVVYNAKTTMNGSFQHPDLSEWNIPEEDIFYDEAYVSLGITDMRGIQERLVVDWNGKSHGFDPGSDNKDLIASGVSTTVPLLADSLNPVYDYSINLDLNGSEHLRFYPVGKETNLHMSGAWELPNFEGAFSPDERDLSNGFSADWKVLSLNRNYPQQWRDAEHSLTGSDFGLNLISQIDDYQRATRSVKYALMMIAFTFLIFFFLEIKSGKRVHPIQLILVGLALIVFYTLLIALSEHFGFNWSYLVSSVAVTVLIAIYFQAIFKQTKMTAILVAVLTIMYGFIFTTLQLENHALLLGSIGLFIVLAMVMYLSRKVDWYALSKGH